MIKGLSLQDTLFNWLTIQIVVDKRPDDDAAYETCKEFIDVLHEDHKVSGLKYDKQDEMYIIHYVKDNENVEKPIPAELAESLIKSIEDETLFVPGFEQK